jgi:hypothetical protein
MTAMGLIMETVVGDGNCLFRCFEAFDPSRDHKQWRQQLVDHLEALVAVEPHRENHYLGRGNAALEDLMWVTRYDKQSGKWVRIQQWYNTFHDLMQAMRRGQWGYTDFILEFSLLTKLAVITFDPSGRPAYNRHPALATVKDTVFMVNCKNEKGMCVDVCSCMLGNAIHSLYVSVC